MEDGIWRARAGVTTVDVSQESVIVDVTRPRLLVVFHQHFHLFLREASLQSDVQQSMELLLRDAFGEALQARPKKER